MLLHCVVNLISLVPIFLYYDYDYGCDYIQYDYCCNRCVKDIKHVVNMIIRTATFGKVANWIELEISIATNPKVSTNTIMNGGDVKTTVGKSYHSSQMHINSSIHPIKPKFNHRRAFRK